VYISHSVGDQQFAHELSNRLKERGLRPWVSSADMNINSSSPFDTQLGKAISSSRHFIFVAGPETSRWQHYESKFFLDATYDQSSELSIESLDRPETRRIIPIIRQGADPRALPGFMTSLQSLQETG
jgi:hypothetical protein